MNADILRFRCVGMKDGRFLPMDEKGNVDPSLEFVMENLAPGAQTLAIVLEDIIVLEDEKHPVFKSHTNWIVWNIPAGERISHVIPDGKGDFGPKNKDRGEDYGWHQSSEFKPPKDGKHLYWFTIYVLDKKVRMKMFPTKKHFLKKARRHIIQQGCLAGEYE